MTDTRARHGSQAATGRRFAANMRTRTGGRYASLNSIWQRSAVRNVTPKWCSAEIAGLGRFEAAGIRAVKKLTQ